MRHGRRGHGHRIGHRSHFHHHHHHAGPRITFGRRGRVGAHHVVGTDLSARRFGMATGTFSCTVVLFMFGTFLLIPGAVLTSQGYSGDWDSPFFASSTNAFKIIGPILLSISFLMILVGIGLCIFAGTMCANAANETNNSVTGTTIVTTTATGGPVVTGTHPDQTAVGPYGNTTAGYPMGQAYPPPGQAYPPPGQSYPPPGQAYPPPGEAYPPPGLAYPATVPGYPPQVTEGYLPPGQVAPPLEGFTYSSPTAPPPSYESVSK